MFSQLFNLIKKPVTVFSSADDNAPVLTSDAGSLKTLLKACLVTGYGDKAGLGWQMKFETEDLTGVVFVSSDVTSGGYHLKVDNSSSNVKLSAYKTMTAFDQGQKALVQDRIYKAQTSEWRLIGHDKAFILLLDVSVQHNGDTKCGYPLLFGDVPSQTKRVAPTCVFWCANANKATNYYQGVGGVQSTLFYHKNGQTGINDDRTHRGALCYPFSMTTGSGGANITTAACRFRYHSRHGGILLYEPILMTLDDGTWSLLPMVLPLSTLSEQTNLSMLTDTLMLARTGWYTGEGNNNDCGVPTDFWWA